MQSHNHFQIPLPENSSLHAELTSWVTMHFLPIYRPVPSRPPKAVNIRPVDNSHDNTPMKSMSEVSIMFQMVTCQFPRPRLYILWECQYQRECEDRAEPITCDFLLHRFEASTKPPLVDVEKSNLCQFASLHGPRQLSYLKTPEDCRLCVRWATVNKTGCIGMVKVAIAGKWQIFDTQSVV
jgi:hypothetical protein